MDIMNSKLVISILIQNTCELILNKNINAQIIPKKIYENIFESVARNTNQIKYVIIVQIKTKELNIKFQLNNIQINIISGINNNILKGLMLLC